MIILNVLFKQNYISNVTPCKPQNRGFTPLRGTQNWILWEDRECNSRTDQRPAQQKVIPFDIQYHPISKEIDKSNFKGPLKEKVSVHMTDKAATPEMNNKTESWGFLDKSYF